MSGECKVYTRLSKVEADKMDSMIAGGHAYNRSEFIRLAIRYYTALCERGYFE